MYHPLIAVEKCLDTTLTTQIGEVCQKTDKFIIAYFNTAYDNGMAIITIKNAEWPYASTKLKVHVTGATLPVAGDEVSQGEAEARKMASPDE